MKLCYHRISLNQATLTSIEALLNVSHKRSQQLSCCESQEVILTFLNKMEQVMAKWDSVIPKYYEPSELK